MLTPTPCAVLGRKEHSSGRWGLTPAGCAAQVGGVIGKAGVIVKQVRDETGARIRVVEGLPSSEERVIVISAPNMAGQPTPASSCKAQTKCPRMLPRSASLCEAQTELKALIALALPQCKCRD